MTGPDVINGLFEAGAGVAQFLNCKALHRDKIVRGVNWQATAFFMSWGLWNLFYYPHLGQFWSWLGGWLIVSANATWVFMYLRYRNRDRVPPHAKAATP